MYTEFWYDKYFHCKIFAKIDFFLGGQPALNLLDANYIFTQIAKLFCLMFHHEQNERSIQDDSKNKTKKIFFFNFDFYVDIIWKKYMAGWREVCDECLTTLFNYHYMCKQCGYMICIECSNQFSQLTIEKRKSKENPIEKIYIFSSI
jgi:hypothetical protein